MPNLKKNFNKNFQKRKNGALIVIDGIDGAGKGTQTQLLVSYMIEKKIPYQVLDFPQYGHASAYFVEKYLRGEYGTIEQVGPRKASLFYALDRFDKSFEIKKWLANGDIIISNRYTTSNIGHQAAKIADEENRTIFLNWLSELEYDFLHIPKPDLVICLYLPPEISQKLVDQKKTRSYTKGLKRDIHEDDIDFLKKSSERYLWAAKKYNWKVIDCSDRSGKEIRSMSEIHNEIIKIIKKSKII
ncbi:MAG TPA: thymidylate kinase [Candidatus Paceibacterota bacterium]|nr:thymidylate kinase [Candidatus Paceibacterota bacterium]HMP18937.1 thymidylate kinase [Candidatus Paceibacterota bacterium]HMP85496.1 thymidylate kinase [Candidatus Paceibacterota bacterium]